MCEITWRLSGDGSQSLYDVNSTGSVEAGCCLCDCGRTLHKSLTAIAGTAFTGNRSTGVPLAFITLKLQQTPDFESVIEVDDSQCPERYLPYVAMMYLLFHGWSEQYGIPVRSGACIKPRCPNFL